jgi:excisionase family DNA binding protein
MTTEYNATITLDRRLPATGADPWAGDVIDKLVGFSPVVARDPNGQASVILTIPATDLRTAITTALALAADATHTELVGLEVIPTADFDRRNGLEPMPALVSVTEAAQLLGVTRQAILQRLESGSLPGEKVGNAWVVQRTAVERATRHTPDVGH